MIKAQVIQGKDGRYTKARFYDVVVESDEPTVEYIGNGESITTKYFESIGLAYGWASGFADGGNEGFRHLDNEDGCLEVVGIGRLPRASDDDIVKAINASCDVNFNRDIDRAEEVAYCLAANFGVHCTVARALHMIQKIA